MMESHPVYDNPEHIVHTALSHDGDLAMIVKKDSECVDEMPEAKEHAHACLVLQGVYSE